MNDKLTANKYIVVRNFIPSDRAFDLGVEFGDYCRTANVRGDEQAPFSSSVYNYISFLELLCEKTPEVSKLIGETTLPTYTYARVYRRGDELIKHVDRPECEISLTVNLGGSEEWDIWIESEGKEIPISLNPGDALIYLGAEAPHWREKFNGDHYYQVFLHYVLSRGKYGQNYFDSFNNSKDPISFPGKSEDLHVEDDAIITTDDEPLVVTDDEPLVVTDDESVIITDDFPLEATDDKPLIVDGILDGSNEVSLKSLNQRIEEIKEKQDKQDFVVRDTNLYKSKKTSKLEDYIHVFEDVLTEEVCDQIIDTFGNDDVQQAALVSGDVDFDSENVGEKRSCTLCKISVPNDLIPEHKRLYLDREIFDGVNKVIQKYKEMHPDVHCDIDTGYELLKYKEGQFYIQHTDSYKEEQRTLSCSFALNDDFEGGEFALFDREIKLKPKKGSVLVFPSNFMYPHEICPVTKNTRYSIITWLV